MTVTAGLLTSTPYRQVWNIANDGLGGGDDITLNNVALQVGAVAGPLTDTLQTAVASDAEAVALMLIADPVMVRICGTGAAAINQWTVDASNDGGLPQLVIASEDTVASEAVLDIVFVHSQVR
jgi:hypothetical protein